MPAIGKVQLGVFPRVILAVGNYSPDLQNAYQAGVSILEARIDLFTRTDRLFLSNELAQLKRVGIPLLATFRPKSEGGSWTGSETERKERLLEILNLVDAVDIELSATDINAEVALACKKYGKTLMVSKHYLENTPGTPVLENMYESAQRLGADIVKLACLARCPSDVTRLLGFVESHKERGLVGISMGPQGSISRVTAPLFGSLLTYTSRELHYGQLPLETLVEFLSLLYPDFNDDLKNRRHPPNTRVP